MPGAHSACRRADPVTVRSAIIVPHTHWDREWYEQEHRFRQRLVETVSDALDLLEKNPEIRVFLLDGQVALVDDYLSVRPQDEHRIRALAQKGRLRLGPWYVLADEFLTTAETLVRNLLIGKSIGERYGDWMPVGYCPDSFGHPAALPTILRGFGMRWAIVWRGYGKRALDPDLFQWTGPDGSSVLTHHLPPDGYQIGAELPVRRDDLQVRWRQLRSVLFPRALGESILIPNGADHHALQPDIATVVSQLADLEPDVAFRIGSPVDYFESLGDVRTECVAGELRDSYGYTWALQGVHSTRSRLKRSMAEAERMLVRWAEPQCALAALAAGRNRKALLDHAWTTYLRSCAHDSIGGCCTDAVARDVLQRATEARNAAQNLFVDALYDRLGQDRVRVRHARDEWQSRLVVINPSPVERHGVVETTVTFKRDDVTVGSPAPNAPEPHTEKRRVFRLVDVAGTNVPFHVLGQYISCDRLDSPRAYPDQDVVDAVRIQVPVQRVPALGCVTLGVIEESAAGPVVAGRASDADRPVRIDHRRVVSGAVTVGSGSRAFQVTDGPVQMTSVFDVVSERDLGDTYTHEPGAGDEPLYANWSAPAIIRDGPYVGCLARGFRVPGRAVGTVYARLDADSRVVRWAVDGRNLVGNHRLRVLFPLPRQSDGRCVADQHFGAVIRKPTTVDMPAYPHEHPVRSAPCHRYVSVTGAGANGLTVFPRGVFEYEVTEDHLAFTVLRAVGHLSLGNLNARPGHAAWPEATPAAQEIGAFRVEFGSVSGAVDDNSSPLAWSELESLAEEFHAPLMRRSVDAPFRVDGPSLAGKGLVFKALKPAERGDGVVFRCVNVSSETVQGRLCWGSNLAGASRVRLDETAIEDLALDTDSRTIRFDAAPREVVSIQVWT
jgi:alpha-mannosidase